MKTLTLKNNQYISDIISFLPTNCIITKPCGKGLTECEIRAKRHSVIVEPNKPVIHGKCVKHREMLGVTKGVYADDVVEYVEGRLAKGEFVKIMVTPESFHKVEKAFEMVDLSLRFDVFLLFDECHKIIEEQGFRSSVSLPMNLFFECEQKALASATPVKMRDERFADFDTLSFLEEEMEKTDVEVRITNNVMMSFSQFLDSHKTGENCPIFVFLNSTDAIFSFIKKYGLEEESAVFCADKSVEKLKLMGYKNAHDVWETGSMAKVNFMTSRFYSALDIDLDFKPDVLILSHVKMAVHTKVNPATSVVQIAGRFRNGVSSVSHITNVNPEFEVRTKEEVEKRIECHRNTYEFIKTTHDSATTMAERDAMNDLIQSHPYRRMFVDEDQNENSFAIDNYVEDKLLETSYHDQSGIESAYKNVEKIHPNFVYDQFELADSDILTLDTKTMTKRELRTLIIHQLNNLGECDTLMEQEYKNDLRLIDPLIVEAYEKLDHKTLMATKLSTKALREAIVIHDFRQKQSGNEIVKLVKNSFLTNKFYPSSFIRNEMKRIYSLFSIIPPKPVCSHVINDYFFCKEHRTKRERGYYLYESKF